MHLTKYRVSNFRSVVDSGWIDAEDVTSLIGENESGKTNLLLPLWKLNPARGGVISYLDDMPRSRFAEMRLQPSRHDFIRCVFNLTDKERRTVEKYGISGEEFQEVEVARNFSGELRWIFPADPDLDLNGIRLPKSDGPEENGEESEEDGEEFEEDLGPTLCDKLNEWLPKFVYYSNYGNLDSQIYLPKVVDSLESDDLTEKEEAKARTIKVLFELVNLSPEEVLELGRATSETERINQQGKRIVLEPKSDEQVAQDDEKLRTRLALLQSASTKLTNTFQEWWKQGDYQFRLQADGSYFRIWVSDKRRKEEIELEHRSSGLQWFLSFFLVFTYESQDSHRDAIVLLDEPGHSLHPLAQRDLSTFFDNLSKTHQLFFTTHSPFMIDADRLDRVRKVYVDDKGATVASSNLSSGAKSGTAQGGASYAVHSALNLSVAESLLLGCTPIIVEGPSDQHYLSAIKTILISKGKIHPDAELVFPPSGGAKTAKIIAGILMGRDYELPTVLLDSDNVGRQTSKSLKSGLYQGHEDRILMTDSVFDDLDNTEIEDLVPPRLIVQVIDRIERRADVEFEDFYESGKPIVPQIKDWAKSEGLELPTHWKVMLSTEAKKKLLNNPEKYVDESILSIWGSLFRKFF